MPEALVLFARYPRLEKVKTRLSPVLSSRDRLHLHIAFLLDTLDRIAQLEIHCYLYLSDCSEKEKIRFASEHSLSPDVRIDRQSGCYLGQRLWNAYRKISGEIERVIFIGCDTPNLPLPYINQALHHLINVPVVIGPAEDGGYYLLGLAEPRPELFEGIDWGTSEVLAQTVGKLSRREYHLLPPWYDVDTGTDLARLQRDLASRPKDLPHRTHQYLRSRSFFSTDGEPFTDGIHPK